MEIIDHNKDEKEPKEELSSSEKINRMYDIFEGTKEGKKRKKPKEFIGWEKQTPPRIIWQY